MDCSNAAVEEALFDVLDVPENPEDAPAIFVVAAPRTGSTLLYQIMAGTFRLPYIANLTNDFYPTTPIVGLGLQKCREMPIRMRSTFGKSRGAFQPSEGSAVLMNWFGGGHPSQVVSASILDGMEPHIRRTLLAVEASYGAPLVIKNPWNCFRIAYLAKALPRARFIWIRRDIANAAMSDLAARYITKQDPNAWNSATPANYQELMKFPPTHQVVENQYEFNKAIHSDLNEHASGRWHDLWYESLVSSPNDNISKIGDFLGSPIKNRMDEESLYNAEKAKLDSEDIEEITRVVLSNERFSFCRSANSGQRTI